MRAGLLLALIITMAVPMSSAISPELIKMVGSLINSAVNEEGQVTIAGRVISYKAKGRVHSLKEPWVYDGTAWDISSGISEKAKHYKSKHGAIKNAMLQLLGRLKKEGIMKEEL
ncbi:uncharacterized protein LOC117300840 [Asterias rubens]|uniref:uncharacterized protein LOC117300840 n=1 Tax=Asterias rubens TaxID=7604 RepID=UPI001455882B|nr:uncharacterized protein LOC117300840 [Asterias rubens]